MANPPYPLSATNLPEFKLQAGRLFRDLYEERLAGQRLGDVFAFEGDKNLVFNYATTGCLKTNTEGGTSIAVAPDYGLILNDAGLSLETKQYGLHTDSGSWSTYFAVVPSTWSITIIYSPVDTQQNYVTSIGFMVGIGIPPIYFYFSGLLPGGEYGFYPQVMAYTPDVWIISAYQTYITSSGEINWLFLKINKALNIIKEVYFAPDHPCFGNGGDPLLVQHPFGKVNDDEEIIVINPTEDQVKRMKYLCQSTQMGKRRKSPLEFIGEGKPFDIGKEEREYPKIPVTIGVVDDEDRRPLWHKETAKITRCIIPQPDYIKVRNLHENS